MKCEAILFDMDGVIIDSEPLHVVAFQETLQRHNKQLSEEQYKQYFAGKTDEEGFRQYFDALREEADIASLMQEKSESYLRLATDKLVAYEGIVELIRALFETTKLALVTGSTRMEADTAMKALGIMSCFSVTICADDISHGKPDPEGYLKAAMQLGVDKSNCVIVEDSPSGVKAAKNAGIPSIAVLNTHTKEELAEADFIVERLRLEQF